MEISYLISLLPEFNIPCYTNTIFSRTIIVLQIICKMNYLGNISGCGDTKKKLGDEVTVKLERGEDGDNPEDGNANEK